MSDDQDGCEWVNVSFGTRGSLRLKAVNRLCVCVFDRYGECCIHTFLVLRMNWRCAMETSFLWRRRSWRLVPMAGTSARHGSLAVLECFQESTLNEPPKQKRGQCTGLGLFTETLLMLCHNKNKCAMLPSWKLGVGFWLYS